MIEALGKFAGPLIAAGGDLLGGFLGSSSAQKRQDDAQAFSAEQFATRYQTTVKDLQAAGLNPMLAYTSGGPTAPSSAAAGASSFGNPGTTFVQSKLASAQEANIIAQTRKTNAEANVTEQFGIKQAEANLDSTLTSIGLTSAQIAKVKAETDNTVAQLNNIKLEGDRLVRAAELLKQQASLAFQQQLTETQRYDMLKAQAALYVSQTGLNNLDLSAAEKLENSGRIGKEIKPFFDMLRSLIRK
jgi:hypothetical protein